MNADENSWQFEVLLFKLSTITAIPQRLINQGVESAIAKVCGDTSNVLNN